MLFDKKASEIPQFVVVLAIVVVLVWIAALFAGEKARKVYLPEAAISWMIWRLLAGCGVKACGMVAGVSVSSFRLRWYSTMFRKERTASSGVS